MRQPTLVTTAAKRSSCPSIHQPGRVSSTLKTVPSAAIQTSSTSRSTKKATFRPGAQQNRIGIDGDTLQKGWSGQISAPARVAVEGAGLRSGVLLRSAVFRTNQRNGIGGSTKACRAAGQVHYSMISPFVLSTNSRTSLRSGSGTAKWSSVALR